MKSALTPETAARFDRAFKQDEARRLRRAYDERLAAALRAGERSDTAARQLSQSQEIAWHLEEGRIDPPELGLEISADDRAFAFSAQGEYIAHCKERTGDTLPPHKLTEIRRANNKLMDQTVELARKMGAAGFNCYRETPFSLYRYHVHSRQVEALPSFRRVTFLPYVAQNIRAPMLSALESYIERNLFCRMWVFTTGPKTPLSDVRRRAQWLHGKLSDLNATDFMRELGVEIVFRSTELGTPEFNPDGTPCEGGEVEVDEAGQMYFHVHAHCVVQQKFGYIPPEKWDTLLDRVGRYWGFWWKESGRIVKPREVCKYVTKPGAMLKMDGPALVALQGQLSRLKLVQPMGALAAEIKRRKAARLILRRDRTPEGSVYREAKNHNVHSRRTRDQKSQDAIERRTLKDNGADKLRIVALGLPGYGAAGVSEARVTVLCTRWDEAAVRRDSRVSALIAATADEYAAGLAIRVHTCTPTVFSERQTDFAGAVREPENHWPAQYPR